MTRCFLAFEFTPESLDYLEKQTKAAHRLLVRDGEWPVRLVRRENWHVTLLFFQGLEAEERRTVWGEVERAAREGVWRGLTFSWQGFAVWPTPRRPSLICLEGEGYPGTALWPLPVAAEPFSKGETGHYLHYRPHATLMRFSRRGRFSVDRDWRILSQEMPAIASEKLTLERVSLFLSTLTAEQPIYPREFSAPIR